MGEKSIALIGAIEGTVTRRLEKDYLFFIKTLRKNGGRYKDIDIHLLQPTSYDILDSTKKELEKLNVKYYKSLSDYNQPHRDFNYTNMPIACEFFYENIREDYEYFLWVDGDVAVTNNIILPPLDDDEISFIYNNEFYDEQLEKYIIHNSKHFIDDKQSYEDLINRIGINKGNYTATNSWFIFAKSSLSFWKDWNILTRKYVDMVRTIGREVFRFAQTNINFENRIEEITMDIVISDNNFKRIYPNSIHTFNTPDLKNDNEYIEKYNPKAIFVHFDDIMHVTNSRTNLKDYFLSSPFLRSQILSTYGFDVYKSIFK